MRTSLCLAALALLMAGSLATVHAKPVRLLDFRGAYRGTVSVTLAGQTYSGTSRILVKTGRQGRSVTMAISGSFQAHGRSFPFSNRYAFSPSRNFTARNTTNLPGSSTRVTGRYTAHKRKLAFRAPFATGDTSGEYVGTIRIRPGRNGKQVLSLISAVNFDGKPSDYLYEFQGSIYLTP